MIFEGFRVISHFIHVNYNLFQFIFGIGIYKNKNRGIYWEIAIPLSDSNLASRLPIVVTLLNREDAKSALTSGYTMHRYC